MLTVEYLQSRLTYDHEVGAFTWKAQLGKDAWNKRYAGKPALNQVQVRGGYLKGKVDNVTLRSHRVAYALHHGHWPEGEVDHINGDVTDNRPGNLRDATPSENCRNQKRPRNNVSGVMGVWFDQRRGRWRAEARNNGTNHKLGSFNTKEEAIAARSIANDRFGYHPNHGRAGAHVG
jgi:hypothetical protein